MSLGLDNCSCVLMFFFHPWLHSIPISFDFVWRLIRRLLQKKIYISFSLLRLLDNCHLK
ncbi:hypothetical protein HanIR_Chr02g0090601 [Helianthus annuus]|nr:hypothetical protein HanIR_Chr02g0090601 [Helianthus annuus]